MGADLDTPPGRALLDGYLRQVDRLPEGVRAVVLPEQPFRSRNRVPAAADALRRTAASRDLDIVVGTAYADGDTKEKRPRPPRGRR
ncbi:hypothetical protein ACFFSW_17085 [Saccharothrix longispora]|uniref:Uncharacterized protein n=1 Tax=Saccharothrix longispora TaxID=33920 RepID=A0ABU1PSL6_9PSEU|nr:hypothetical protein [Saccharothrix longispora]MDR6593642.1 hypothetical protein [Saccharothrix longispora]